MADPSLTDPLTYATAFTYGTGGRIQSVTRADNTTEALTAVEVPSLAAAGTGTQANPATTVLAAQAQATYSRGEKGSGVETRFDSRPFFPGLFFDKAFQTFPGCPDRLLWLE